MITLSFAICMIVLFLHACSWDGMIFAGIKKVIKPESWLSKPLYGCPICMTPYYGSLIYWLFIGTSWQLWLLTVGMAAGMSVLVVVILALRELIIQNLKD